MAIRQLFLSKSVVTELDVFDGGVLVDENGIIEDILRRDQCEILINKEYSNIKVVDGGGLALLAGVVDSHVHVNEPGRTAWEGFRTATAAAAVGGVTTIIDMPLNSIPPTTTISNLKVKVNAARENVYVDVGFWGGVIPVNQDSLKDLVKAGVIGFKCFLCPSGVEEFPNVNADDLENTFAALEDTGSLLAFHAELETENLNLNCSKFNHQDPEEYQTYLKTRSSEMEISAVKLIMDFINKTSVRVHIVHVSSAGVIPLLEVSREARRVAGNTEWRGGVTAETCHHYLSLCADQVPKGRSEFKCAPPIRDQDNKDKLWQYLLEGKLDLVVSDHSPCTPELKCSNNLKAWGGISSLQFGLSLLWQEASSRGQDLRFVTKYLSAGPARLCNLHNRKGAIQPGLDADLIFFDPEATFMITQEIIQHKNKLTPYLNQKLKGVVRQTYLRGQLIYSEGTILGEPKGKLLINI